MAQASASGRAVEKWQRFPIRRIEDLRNAVLGAGLEAMQMAGPPLRGSLAFCASHGMVFSTGLIGGKVALRGALASDAVTLLLFPTLGSGSRLWLTETRLGEAVVLMPGGELDAICAPHSAYLAATLTKGRLEEEVALCDRSVRRGMFGRTSLHRAEIPFSELVEIRRQVDLIHRCAFQAGRPGLGMAVLRLILGHISRVPTTEYVLPTNGRARIVRVARDYIHKHLSTPIHISDLEQVTGVSARTLNRAFNQILEETPQSYVRRVRLHGVRRDLVSRRGVICTIGDAAARWGAGSDPGRLAVRYRELFGEKPSKTLATARDRSRQTEWM